MDGRREEGFGFSLVRSMKGKTFLFCVVTASVHFPALFAVFVPKAED